jgi:ankyrin repeat protein
LLSLLITEQILKTPGIFKLANAWFNWYPKIPVQSFCAAIVIAVKQLFSSGISPNVCGSYGFTPLHQVCSSCNLPENCMLAFELMACLQLANNHFY